jgi:ubiquinone/menaquinone biosynthesis C-methylase UbiE
VLKRFLQGLKMPRADRPADPAGGSTDPGLIDVKRLIGELSDEDLMASADAYFQPMTLASEQCRKPFSNPRDSVHLARHLALVLEAADLHAGARVLEVGCGTGWLTLGLAQMGCDAVGVDISPAAVRLAQGLQAARAGEKIPGKSEFLSYDGKTLPLPDASVDRVICYDAFHHVRDQGATIHEFARVLRDGGRAAFLEPGPEHSKTPASQSEMARYRVIENDVVMAEVSAHARAAGFEKPRMLVQLQQPFELPVDEFIAWASEGVPHGGAAALLRTLSAQLTNSQCFYLYKGGQTRDSRDPDGLAARLELLGAERSRHGQAGGIRLAVRATNTGNRDWITARLSAGQVNLGVQLLGADGRVIDHDFSRLKLPAGPIRPGDAVTIEGTIRMPPPTAHALQLDLVAEMVAWFGDLGSTQRVWVPLAAIEPPADH